MKCADPGLALQATCPTQNVFRCAATKMCLRRGADVVTGVGIFRKVIRVKKALQQYGQILRADSRFSNWREVLFQKI